MTMSREEEDRLDAEAIAKATTAIIDLAEGVYEKAIAVDFPNDDGNPTLRIKFAIAETLRSVEQLFPLYAENEEGSSCLPVSNLANEFYDRVNT